MAGREDSRQEERGSKRPALHHRATRTGQRQALVIRDQQRGFDVCAIAWDLGAGISAPHLTFSHMGAAMHVGQRAAKPLGPKPGLRQSSEPLRKAS